MHSDFTSLRKYSKNDWDTFNVLKLSSLCQAMAKKTFF